MKKSLSMLGLLMMAIIVSHGAFSSGITPNKGEEKEFGDLKKNLDQAIEGRNFKEAKELLAEIFPLMKADIKKSKKNLSHYQKEESTEINVEEYATGLARKSELFNSMKHLVDASPAALRAKSSTIISMVTEFDKLMDKT